jgi:hypothetical protein
MNVRVKVTEPGGKVVFGYFVGMVTDCERCADGAVSAAVLVDGQGMFLQLYHPSRVHLRFDQSEDKR